MYESFFNLTTKPFDLLPNPDFLFLSKSHKRALSYLDYGIRDRVGFILLTGEVGSGKTTIIRNLIKKHLDNVILSKIFNTRVDSDQLIAMINDDFGLPVQNKSKITLLRELNDFLIEQYVRGNQPVLVIDEAQNLSPELLEEIRLLSNLETDNAKLLQIILVGQPELRHTLATPAMVQLRQRISINCHLRPLSRFETALYILHRLEMAGNRNAVSFAPETLDIIFKYSRGIPRLVNIICDFLMISAFADETSDITVDMANDVIGDLDFEHHFWGTEQGTCHIPDGGESEPAAIAGSVGTEFTSLLREINERLDTLGKESETVNSAQLQAMTTKIDTLEKSLCGFKMETYAHISELRKNLATDGTGQKSAELCDEGDRKVKGGFFRRFMGWGAIIVLMLPSVAYGGDFQVHPSITVGEEYTDNVFLTSDHRTSDFITRALPGIALAYKAPALDANVNYQFDYRYYAKRSIGTDQTHDISANGKLTAIDNLLFLEVGDQYQRVSQDISKDLTQESLFVNQTDQNVASVSPYITLQPTSQTKVKAGYRFLDYRYFDNIGIDKTDHIGFLELAYEFTPKWSATGGYTYTREESVITDYDQHQPYVGFRYEYADKSYLFGQVGYTWTTYSDGHRLNNVYWNAGFSHTFDTLVATISTGVRYDEDPLQVIIQEKFVNGSLEKRLQRGALGVTLYYSEYSEPDTNNLQTKKYGGTVHGSYEFTSRLSGKLAFTAEKYDQQFPGQPPLDTYTRRFVVDSGLGYLLADKLTLSLNHIIVDSYSPGLTYDNYQVNRMIVELKKVF